MGTIGFHHVDFVVHHRARRRRDKGDPLSIGRPSRIHIPLALARRSCETADVGTVGMHHVYFPVFIADRDEGYIGAIGRPPSQPRPPSLPTVFALSPSVCEAL